MLWKWTKQPSKINTQNKDQKIKTKKATKINGPSDYYNICITHAMFFNVVVYFFFCIYLFEWSTMRNVCFGLGGVDSFIWITYINISYVNFLWKVKVRRDHFFFFFQFILNNKMCVKNVWFPFHLVSDPRPSLILLFHVLRFFFTILLHPKHVSLSFSFSIFNSAIHPHSGFF